MMTHERAIRLAQRWAEGGVCTLRGREAQEYHKLCLKAMRERKEREEGCEYCMEPHPARDCILPDGTEQMLVVYPDGTFLGKPFVHERKVKFCPMCGRRLEGGKS